MKTTYLSLAAIALAWSLAVVAQQETKPAGAPVKISGAEATQLLLKSAEAVYPEGVKDLKGFVALELRIDTEGNVADVTVRSGKAELAAIAVAAFKQYKFKPYMVNGAATECLISATANFTGPGEARLSFLPLKMRVSQGVMDANKTRDVPPQYPMAARDAHLQGDVVLRATIDTQGNMTNLMVVSGHPVLAAAALDAVKLWKYKPYLVNGDPVEIDTVITIKFHM